ncbi:hypothetical protein Tco_1276893, partial [Tanacetum coccineum]
MSPPLRVPPPPPTQESGSMDITLTFSPITPLDVQFNTPSPPLPLFGHPIPWNLLEAHNAIAKFRSPSRWKGLSKEMISEILPIGDGSRKDMFKPIA